MSLARTDESVSRERAAKASDRLLASLRRHHGEEEPPVVVPVPEPPKPLPPIPNAVIAGACKIAFPPIIINQIEAIQRAVLREYPGLTMGSEIELAPTPDANYTIEMVYRQNIPALASNTTNWLLTAAPDLYLYGTLLETAPYLKEDERIQTWALGLKTALDSLNTANITAAFNASPLTMRPSGVTP